MAKIYYDKDADPSLLSGKKIGIMGYGSQGHAHAQNLRDSGCQVIVAEAKGSQGWKDASTAGFNVLPADEAAKQADIIVMRLPDQLQRQIYYQSIEKGLAPPKLNEIATNILETNSPFREDKKIK